MARLGLTESEVLKHAHICAHEGVETDSLESIASAKADKAAFHAAQAKELALWDSMNPEQRTAHRAAEQQAAAEKQAEESPARQAAWLADNAAWAAKVDARLAARAAKKERDRAEARAAREKFDREVASLREANKAAKAAEAAERAAKKAADEEATRAAVAAVRAEYAAKLEAEKAAKAEAEAEKAAKAAEVAPSDWLPVEATPVLNDFQRQNYEFFWGSALSALEPVIDAAEIEQKRAEKAAAKAAAKAEKAEVKAPRGFDVLGSLLKN
jgi:colicin import membrane protein